MSGHSKWSKIKHKKAVDDVKKSKVFSILSRTITMESKRAHGDRNDPGLRTAIEKARGANMPSLNIDRAIAKGAGSDANSYTEVLYEAYGPGGAQLLLEGITDNANRTSAEIKHLLSLHGGTLGGPGSVTWGFERKNDAWEPKHKIELDQDDRKKLEELEAALEEHDDIKNVSTNC
jgi:YebC/PmpR family DNA-binding regulatory protein